MGVPKPMATKGDKERNDPAPRHSRFSFRPRQRPALPRKSFRRIEIASEPCQFDLNVLLREQRDLSERTRSGRSGRRALSSMGSIAL